MDIQHKQYMEQVFALAISNVQNSHGGPFGAMIVRDGNIVAQATNQVTATHDPTAHAEIQAIRLACKRLKTHQLIGCTIYTSCEPCPMCLGAIYWARLDSVFYGATKDNAASAGFDDSYIYKQIMLSGDKRAIPFIQWPSPQQNEPFQIWQKEINKILY